MGNQCLFNYFLSFWSQCGGGTDHRRVGYNPY